MKSEKLKIIAPTVHPRDVKIFLGNKELKQLKRLIIEMDSNKPNQARIEMYPSGLEIKGKFEIQKEKPITSLAEKILVMVYNRQEVTPDILMKQFKDDGLIRQALHYLKDIGWLDFIWLLRDTQPFNFSIKGVTPQGIRHIELKGD